MNKRTPIPPIPLIDADEMSPYLESNDIQLIPLHRPDAVSDWNGKPRKDGKRPLEKDWTTREYDSRKVVAECVAEGRNVGVRLKPGQLVVDVDPRNGGTEGFARLCADLGLDPNWPRVITGGGGSHFYLRKPAEVKVIDSVEAYPGVEFNGDKLNLWRGWAVEPSPGDWSLMRGLIRDVLCGGVDAHGDYVERWIAYMLQHPGKMPEVAIAFRGEEGTGKGTLGRALMSVAGTHGLTVSSPGQFAGRFNAHLRDCVFLFADEAFWPGDKEAEGVLK